MNGFTLGSAAAASCRRHNASLLLPPPNQMVQRLRALPAACPFAASAGGMAHAGETLVCAEVDVPPDIISLSRGSTAQPRERASMARAKRCCARTRTKYHVAISNDYSRIKPTKSAHSP